ncbi:Retrovirus-related Pol polyprotein from transposon 17.6, partial [Mucuna pruriens]
MTILDGMKKEVTKLLVVGIIYPIEDSQWVSPVQVVSKKSRMTIIKNWQDEIMLARIQNNWKFNQATRKDHFPLPFIDKVLEKLAGESPFLLYADSHNNSGLAEDHLYITFAYTRMPFGLCNALSTFQRCMISIFSSLLEDCVEVFMDDFTVYAESFEACLNNLSRVLHRCIKSNLVLNFEKCHFMVTEGIVLGHLVSTRGIKVDKAKIDVISFLFNPASMREVRLFLGHAGFYKRFIKDFNKIACFCRGCYRRMWTLCSISLVWDTFQELKRRLTFAPILQAPN